MPMNTLERERHLRSFASAPIQEAIALCRITIALFISAMSRSNIIGLPRRWTMDFGSRSLSKKLSSVGSSVGAQSLWERASSFSTTPTNVARTVRAFNNRLAVAVAVNRYFRLNNSAIDRRSTCSGGRRNYRSNMRADYSAVPKTVFPRLRQQHHQLRRREARRPQAPFRHQMLRRRHQPAKRLEQQIKGEPVQPLKRFCAW